MSDPKLTVVRYNPANAEFRPPAEPDPELSLCRARIPINPPGATRPCRRAVWEIAPTGGYCYYCHPAQVKRYRVRRLLARALRWLGLLPGERRCR